MNYKSLLCSCLICRELKSAKGIFTHHLRSHGSDEEKEKLNRGNSNHSIDRHRSNNLKAKKRKELYNLNPVKCKNCFSDLLYNKKHNNFCSRSCSASYNNRNHIPGRKFGPSKSKIEQIKKIRPVKAKIVKISKPIKKKQYKWSTSDIVGPYSRLFNCVCSHCHSMFLTKKKSKYCTSHTDLYSNARNRFQFTFNVYHYSDLFNIKLITEYGWYSPGNRGPKNNNGVSRDHRISVNQAIKHNYDAYYISHPLNCKIMLHSDNKKKYTKSSINYKKLVALVDLYESVYGGKRRSRPESVLPQTK